MPSFLYNVVLSLGYVPCRQALRGPGVARMSYLIHDLAGARDQYQQFAIKVTMGIKVCLDIIVTP